MGCRKYTTPVNVKKTSAARDGLCCHARGGSNVKIYKPTGMHEHTLVR